MKHICPHCEKETECTMIRVAQKIEIRSEQIPVDAEYLKCEECHHQFDDPQSELDTISAAYREYRKRHGMLQPEEMKKLRKKYGLTQQEMVAVLGWGIATLSRFENGALQDDAHEKMLRLIADPRNFLKLLEQNPQVLSDEKRNKLTQELKTTAGKETNWLEHIFEEYFGNTAPDEFNGYQRLNLDKLLHTILFFCQEGVCKTKLNKLLFYADFKHFKEYAVSITGVQYARITYGPVPDQYEHYYATLCSKGWLKAEEKEGYYVETDKTNGETQTREVIWEKLISSQKPDLGLFSTSELKILASVKEYFADFTAKKIADFSHEEQGYKETENGRLISYNYAKELKI